MAKLKVTLSLCVVFLAVGSGEVIPEIETTCPLSGEGSMTFLVSSSSPNGPINLLLVKYNSTRGLPILTTALHDSLNNEKIVSRSSVSEPFGPVSKDCLIVPTKQFDCSGGISMTSSQKAKATPRYTWDRGHLTPANPMRFDAVALSKTFYCVNLAPQDSYTNQIPWMILEVTLEKYINNAEGYVMTGVCSEDNLVDGPTSYRGYHIPNCFWKLACYKDPDTSKTEVVGFMANNTIVNFSDTEAQRNRNTTTFTVRSQSEITPLIYSPNDISEGWRQAADNLQNNRQASNLPDYQECQQALSVSESVKSKWENMLG